MHGVEFKAAQSSGMCQRWHCQYQILKMINHFTSRETCKKQYIGAVRVKVINVFIRFGERKLVLGFEPPANRIGSPQGVREVD